MSRLRLALVAVLLSFALQPATAADMATPPPAAGVADPVAATRSYLERYAVLLMIRNTFDVVEDVEAELADETARLDGAPSAEDEALLDRNLIAEGSYYLVSLRYLIAIGGAAWPEDRPESSYANDALVTLDALEERLIETVNDRADPLPLFVDAQRVLVLTEGLTQMPPDLDRFAGRDALVDEALREQGPRTSV